MPYKIDWKTKLLEIEMGLDPKDIAETLKILGDEFMVKSRGNRFAPGLYHICYPSVSICNYGGIDFPCLIHNGNIDRDTIVIVGAAPQRNKYTVNKMKPCSLGSPYAIVFKEYPDQCWIYKQVFKILLGRGYNLYLTDVDKLWTSQKLVDKKPCHNDEMLSVEIGQIRHVKIVTFGRYARDVARNLLKVPKLQNNISHLYHPSQRNIERWLNKGGAKDIEDIPHVIVEKIMKNDDMFLP